MQLIDTIMVFFQFSQSLPLAMVMLFDFQDRGFVKRDHSTKEEEEPMQEVRDLEESLQRLCVCVFEVVRSGKRESAASLSVYARACCRCKTKLAASLARYRVKQCLQSVSCFLSEPVRTKQSRAKHLPLYPWVNTFKTRYAHTHTHTHFYLVKTCKRCSLRKKWFVLIYFFSVWWFWCFLHRD